MRFVSWSSLTPLCGALMLHAVAAQAATTTGVTMVVADMDNDNNPEIVALDPSNAQVDVIEADNDGNFTLHAQDFGDIDAMTSLAVADVNGDGWPDVVIGNGSGTSAGIRVLINNGDGTLAPDVSYSTGPLHTHGPVAVALADVNGDGRPDIVTANEAAGTVSVLLNKGDGTFAAAVTYPAGKEAVALAVADLNGDHKPDIVVADFIGNSVLVLLNKGDGTYGPPTAEAVGIQPVALSLADVDEDGHLDIVVANQGDNTAGVLLGHSDGSFGAPTFYHTGARPAWITAQDLNGDGKPELVTDNYSDGSVSLFENTGHTFNPPQQLFPDYGSYGTLIMDIGGAPQVVSANVQAGRVQVTSAAAAVVQGNAASGSVRHINGARTPQSSGGGGSFGRLSLILLGIAGLCRRIGR